jgi:threonine dehydratase
MTADDFDTPVLTIEMIRAAHDRIRDKIHRTPLLTSEVLDNAAKLCLFFKCENLQKAGAFKARGATNAVFLLTPQEAAHGVVTHSSGNHAAALARAARLRGIPAHIVMPDNSPLAKQAAVRRYGGLIELCEPTLAARESTAREVVRRTGAAFIHPYDDLRVMAGQGTSALEILQDVPALDAILCPVGGGGNLSGVAVAAKSIKPSIRVIGVEPAGADDAARSFRAGRLEPLGQPRTIADGLRTSLGRKPFAEILRHVDDIVTVSEASIIEAMRTIWEVLKVIVEPSGAVAYAAIVEKSGLNLTASDPRAASDRRAAPHPRVAILLTGGNLDLDHLPWQKA